MTCRSGGAQAPAAADPDVVWLGLHNKRHFQPCKAL
jgi:hypothetical protein